MAVSAVASEAFDARPQLPPGERVYQAVLSGGLAALGFFVLFSTAGTYVAMAVLLVLCLLSPRRLLATRPWREPVLAIGLVMLAYLLLRSAAAGGLSRNSFAVVNRYHELLMLPLLWALMRNARRPQAFANGLMLGAVVFAAMHWLAPLLPGLASFVLQRRVSAGFGLAICAFLLFEHARLGRLPAAQGYGAAVFLAATVIFAGEGRTGHVVLLALLVCAAFRAAPPRVRLAVVLAIAVTGVLVAGTSKSVRLRATETLHDAREASNGTVLRSSSTAIRVQLMQTGAEVATTHWLLGTGLVHYPAVFKQTARETAGPAAPATRHDNPHNEYLLQLGAGGLPALALYILWLAWPMTRSLRDRRTHRPWTGAVGCVALAFALASLFNSVLLDFVEGHFYGALLAWLLVRRVED